MAFTRCVCVRPYVSKQCKRCVMLKPLVFRIWRVAIRTNNSLSVTWARSSQIQCADGRHILLRHSESLQFRFVLPPLPIEVLGAKKPIHCSEVSKSDPSMCLVVIPTTSGSSHACRAGACAVYSAVSASYILFACQ